MKRNNKGAKKPPPLNAKRKRASIRAKRRALANRQLRAMEWSEIEKLAEEPIQDHLHSQARKLRAQLLAKKARVERARIRELEAELRKLTSSKLRNLLSEKRQSSDRKAIENALRQKLYEEIRAMTTQELQAISETGTSEWPMDLVEMVLQGRRAPIPSESANVDWWREQD